jgi:hypothetical protein
MAQFAAALIAQNKSVALTAGDLGLNPESLRLALKRHGLKPAIPARPGGHPPYKLTKDHALAAAGAIARG